MNIDTKTTDTGEALWERVTDGGCKGYFHTPFFLSHRKFSNMSEILGIGVHDGLNRMMRASGISEAYVTGGASDYDKSEALCRVLPLWSGHPYYYAIHALISRLFGITQPLNVQNLPEIWRLTAESLLDNPIAPSDLPSMWGITKRITALSSHNEEALGQEREKHDEERRLYLGNLIHTFWDPTYQAPISAQKPAEDMARRVNDFLDERVVGQYTGITLDLSALNAFVRPDPYTPAQAVLRLQSGKKPLEACDQRLIISQTLRLLGGACAQRSLKMTIIHADADVVHPLCAYLDGCGCLPDTTVALSHPCDLLPTGVTSMLYLPEGMPPETLAETLTAYAAQMPLGCLGGLYMPICSPLDLPLWEDAGRTLCEFVARFGEMGRGTRDFEEQAFILQNILS